MFNATRFVVAGAIVALFGGFLLAGFLALPANDELAPAPGVSASASASAQPREAEAEEATRVVVELPAEIPEGIESGRLDTPLGAAGWVYLSGDPGTLPDILRPIPVPGGSVSLDEGSRGGPCPSGQVSCVYPAELWFSPDLIEWTRRPLPG